MAADERPQRGWSMSKSKSLRAGLACCLTIAWFASAVAADEPVAMVTDLQGEVTLVSPPKGEPPSILGNVKPGAIYQVADNAALVVVYFASGQEFSFKGPTMVQFDAGGPITLAGNEAETRNPLMGKVGTGVKIKPVGKVQAAVVMRSASQTSRLKLLTLVGTKTLDAQPEFRWETVDRGAVYEFELTDATGRTLYEAETGATSLKLPADVKLVDGQTYTWLVSARLADGKKYSNAADFSVVTADLRRDVEAVRPGANAPLSERVTYAAWLDQLQLHDEAKKYWKSLAAARAGDENLSQLARDE
jgi:hypothetical protein